MRMLQENYLKNKNKQFKNPLYKNNTRDLNLQRKIANEYTNFK